MTLPSVHALDYQTCAAVVRYLRRVVPRGDAEAAELAALIELLSPSPHPG